MSGGGGGVIILKNLKAASQLSVVPSGKLKLWHLFLASHAVNALGWLF